MPKYRITSPSGQTFEINAPDGASQEDVLAYARANMPGGQAPKRNAFGEVAGFMANVNRGLGIGDEMAAGFKTAGNVLSGKTPVTDVVPDFQRSMASQRQLEDSYAREHPVVAPLAKGTGNALTALVPAGKTANAFAESSRLMNAARGATTAGLTAAGYAAADRGTARERLKAASDASVNPVVLGLGAGFGALAPSAPKPKPAKTATPTPQQRNTQILEDAKVFMTPGQKAGGAVKNAEDLARRAPILGAAIKGAANRSVESLNRAVADRALEPVGAYLPKDVHTGHDSVTHVAQTLGKVYDDAASMVPEVALDAPYKAAVSDIAQRLSEQPAGVQDQFNAIVANRLGHLDGKVVSGAQVRESQSQISKLAADFSASNDGAQRALGGALDDVSDELANVIGRKNPEAGAMIDKANTGWSVYTRLRNAASKAKGGVFTPGQLATAVRTLDRSVGKGNVAKGQAVLQDLSNAAWETLPDSYGNPGTADALSAMSLGAAAATPATAPAAIPAAAGLTAAATPYFLMGRKVVERIPGNATPAELRAASQELARLVTKDPAVAALQREVAARLSRAAGVAGASASQRNAFAEHANP